MIRTPSHTNNKTVSIQARRYPFAGAVLTTQHARELTPTLVLLTIQALSEKVLGESFTSISSSAASHSQTANNLNISQQQPNVGDSPRSAFSSSSVDALHRSSSHNKHKVQYTVCTFPFPVCIACSIVNFALFPYTCFTDVCFVSVCLLCAHL